MFNKNLIYYVLGRPIPKPVTDLESLRYRLVFNDEKIIFKDLFLGVISCLYNGYNRPPNDYRLFDKEVIGGGLVQYDPEVKSWKGLLAKTAKLLRENDGSLDEKRRIFESWLPKRLGWLGDKQLAKFLGFFENTICQLTLINDDDWMANNLDRFLEKIHVFLEVDDARKLFK